MTSDPVESARGGWAFGVLILLVAFWMLPGANEPYLSPKLGLVEAAVLLAAVAALWHGWRGAALRVDLALMPPLVVLAAVILASRVLAAPSYPRWEEAGSDLTALGCVVAVIAFVTGYTALAAVTSLAALAAAAAGLAQVIAGAGAPAWFGNPSFGAAFLAVSLPVVAGMAVRAPSPGSPVGWVAAVGGALVAAGLVLTGSRTGWIAGGIGVAVAVAGSVRQGGREGVRRVTVALGITVVFVVLALAARSGSSPWLGDRMATAIRTGSSSIGGRLVMWRVSAEMARQRPLLGRGPGGYFMDQLTVQAAVLRDERHAAWRKLWTFTQDPHNDAVRILAEAGIAGLGAWSWLFAAAGKRWRLAWRTAPMDDRAVLAGWAGSLAAFIVLGLASFPFRLPANMPLFAIALAAPVVGITRVSVARFPVRGWPRIAVAAGLAITIGWLGLAVVHRQAAGWWAGQGMALAQAGNLAGAESALNRGLEHGSAGGAAWLFLGNVALLQGRPGEAEEALLRARAWSPDPHVVFNLGLAALARGNHQAARRWFLEALAVKPEFPEPLTGLGDAARRTGNAVEAEGWYRAAVAADPGYFAARRQLGFIYFHRGDLREALDQFLPVANAAPEDRDVGAALDAIKRRGLKKVRGT